MFIIVKRFKKKSYVFFFFANKSQSRDFHKTLFRNVIVVIGGHLSRFQIILGVRKFFKVCYKELMSTFTCIYLLKCKLVNWDLLKMRCRTIVSNYGRTEKSCRGLLSL